MITGNLNILLADAMWYNLESYFFVPKGIGTFRTILLQPEEKFNDVFVKIMA